MQPNAEAVNFPSNAEYLTAMSTISELALIEVAQSTKFGWSNTIALTAALLALAAALLTPQIQHRLQLKRGTIFRRKDLRYEACLKALSVIDAYLSSQDIPDNSGNKVSITKQYTTPEEVRMCHSELMLTVGDGEIISKFMDIISGRSSNAIKSLEKLRELIRAELGFGDIPVKDTESIWLAVIESGTRSAEKAASTPEATYD